MSSTTEASTPPAWDLSHLIDLEAAGLAGPEGPGPENADGAAAVDALLSEAQRRAEAFAERYEGKVADLDGAGLLEAMTELAAISELAGRALNYAHLQLCRRHRRPGDRRPAAELLRARHPAQTEPPLLRARVGRDRRRAGRAAARDRRARLLPPSPAARAALPRASAERARGADHLRALGQRRLRLEPAVRRAAHRRSGSMLPGARSEPVTLDHALSGLFNPDRESAADGRGRHRGAPAGPADPRLRLQHAAAGEGDQGPAAQLPALARDPQPLATRPATSRSRRWSRRSRAATNCRAAGTGRRRACSASTSSPTTTGWRSSPPTTRRSNGTRAARSSSTPSAPSRPRLREVVERFFDEALDRRAARPEQARRRLQRLDGSRRSTPT